jgi:hypothetical protein
VHMYDTTVWNREFLDMHLTRCFMKGPFKKHREDILLERELALLPNSQNMVQNYREAEALSMQYTELDGVVYNLYREIDRIKHEQRQIKRGISTIKDSNYQQSSGLFADASLTTFRPQVDYRRLFHCPHDNCRGFMDGTYHCVTCDKYACRHCGCPLAIQNDHQHVCDPSVLETHTLLLRDSKPCPGCCVPIHKVQDGACNQM